MAKVFGGHDRVMALAAPLPRVPLPEWEAWQLEALSGPPAPAVVDHAFGHVEHQGWTVMGSDLHDYIYSVGLTHRGWPELVFRVSTMDLMGARDVLCELVEEANMQHRDLHAGQQWHLMATCVELSAIDDRWAPGVCAVAGALYGTDVRAAEVTIG